MNNIKQQFIQLAIDSQVLRFGEFILKSGRKSPYFFNAGRFDSGTKLAILGEMYARSIQSSQLAFDILYGPAYKGIPLVASIAVAYHALYGKDIPYSYNRKEIKDHGEGGQLVGAPLKGSVLIVDDVISAGTSVRESINTIQDAGATPVAVAIALDRQEKGEASLSAVQEVEQTFSIPVISIATLSDLVDFMDTQNINEIHLNQLRKYHETYGV